ncbi:ATP-binding protein [Marinovum sp. 2_MG-2023]|uniref:ATP-binding protein n=1 Tax=unclassified Marinovum TaxID=2647166 RepID=UPI0026E233E3|nr:MULTISPECIES: ATP-binding protein [unclassified Marinovum]MDO6731625.1 ATP-binding protein [Marinovum sp. 2_MG-2023]MDO6778249.1 ATP-binding protein [Marinovum sp. 1_MG-2023]
MSFHWLKRYMPRSLYGRAALILVLPVVTLQLVVTVIFVQRHFQGVTEQLTRSVRDEIRLIVSQPAADDTPRAALAAMMPLALPLDFSLAWRKPATGGDLRRWFDLSGRVVIRELRNDLDGVVAISLPNDRDTLIYMDLPQGVLELRLDRKGVSASNPHQLIVNMVIFSLLMTPIAFIYMRNQLRPITRLASAAEAFGRGRVVPYSPGGAVEVRAAGHAFLDMRARIERQIEQRTLMLSGVSHDLRTPLTRLKLGLAMQDEDEVADLNRDIRDMERMLDEFLDFVRGNAEAGEATPTDPMALVQQAVEDAQRAEKPVTLITCEGDGHIALRPVAIRRAIDNLIENATRYGTNCAVSARLTDKSLRIRVEDDGPGIPEDMRAAAVRAFVRLDKSRNQSRAPGVGLGLAIATDIARAHGGVLRLGKSDRLGGLCADIVIAR